MSDKNMWDEVAKEYEEYSYHKKDNNYPANKFRAKIIFDFLDKQEKGRVLDAGCGTGFVTRELIKKGWDCISIDLSENMLSVAKKKAEQESLKADFRHCSVLDLSMFKDKEFDVIMLNGVLPYINEEDEIKAYNECKRVLKDNGSLIIAQYNSFFDFFMAKSFELKKLIASPQVIKPDKETMKYENPLTYKDKLRKYGFSEDNQFYYNFHVSPPDLTTEGENDERVKVEERFFDKWQGMLMARTFVSIARKV
jgi:ubiquinone/menaquinone biosynthesis C-methylase UbiE